MRLLALAASLIVSITAAHAQETQGQHKAPVTEIRQAAVAFLEGKQGAVKTLELSYHRDRGRGASDPVSPLEEILLRRSGVFFGERPPQIGPSPICGRLVQPRSI